VADPLKTRFCTTCVTIPTLVILGQTTWAHYGDPPEKINPYRVTQGYWNRQGSIGLWLPVSDSDNHGQISYRFRY